MSLEIVFNTDEMREAISALKGHRELTTSQSATLAYFVAHTIEDQTFFCTRVRLMKDMNVNTETARRRLTQLYNLDYLYVQLEGEGRDRHYAYGLLR